MAFVLDGLKVTSMLDVGCGTGTWMKAALNQGIIDVRGVDGVAVDPDQLHIPSSRRTLADLTKPWQAERRFDLVVCMEVAEHLPESAADILIQTLVTHGDIICFSAACPNQAGENHINCQWPAWWQCRFNDHGFTCDDSLRWRWWNQEDIEPWYRQNTFFARRSNTAGNEPRIASVVHPAMLPSLMAGTQTGRFEEHQTLIEQGCMSLTWYLTLPWRALLNKVMRKQFK